MTCGLWSTFKLRRASSFYSAIRFRLAERYESSGPATFQSSPSNYRAAAVKSVISVIASCHNCSRRPEDENHGPQFVDHDKKKFMPYPQTQ